MPDSLIRAMPAAAPVRRLRRTRWISPMMRRILLVNALPLALLVATLLYLNQFQSGLLQAEVGALREQARIYAGALGQSAVGQSTGGQGSAASNGGSERSGSERSAGQGAAPQRETGARRGSRGRGPAQALPSLTGGAVAVANPAAPGDAEAVVLVPSLARPLLGRLTEPSPSAQAKLYAPDGQVIADSHGGGAETWCGHAGAAPDGATASAAGNFGEFGRRRYGGALGRLYDRLLAVLPLRGGAQVVPVHDDAQTEPATGGASAAKNTPGGASDAPECRSNVREQLRLPDTGDSTEAAPNIWRTADGRLLVQVVEPVAHEGHTVGIIQLTREADGVDRSLFEVRASILGLFVLALVLTVLLSWYLSLTIARPILSLATAAHTMREGSGRTGGVPPRLGRRRDEIGELSQALDESARALWGRMDAIERFAADVSHEIKNPLSSIRSAIETALRIEDVAQQRRLLAIIGEDVRRLDRLITDISDASRVDAELSRTVPEPVAVEPILSILAEMNAATRKPGDAILAVEAAVGRDGKPLRVLAVEDRLVQVLRNLIGNAVSFSPPDGRIVLRVAERGNMVEIAVDDEGPGIPEAKLDSIFDRFYSERPASEHFGQHSGLGLSISRQIVDTLKGSIGADNRKDADGHVLGARFVVRLPRADAPPPGRSRAT